LKNYIVFEGCDYTGKTTLAKAFIEFLDINCFEDAFYTKEPGSPHSDICLKIRELIINNKESIFPETYSYLFAADTFQHLNSIVMPNLHNRIVVSDRSVISDFAYRPNVKANIRDYNFNYFKSLDPLIIWCRAMPDVIQERYERRQDTNEFERIHVMNKIDQINKAYQNFFYDNQGFNVIEHFSQNDNGESNKYLFDQIVRY
jgi:dTMP kinase